MGGALILARFTFREAIRKKMVIWVLVLSAIFVGLYAYGFSSLRSNYLERVADGQEPPFGFAVFAGVMTVLGFYTVNFLSGVMAIFASVGSVAAEVDAGTFHAIVPKPVSRWEIVLGKWLGYALMLAAYVSLMCLSVLLVARYIGGYTPPNRVAGSALVVLVSLVLLSLTVLGSTFFSSLTNGIIVFMLYGVALMGGVVEQIGEFLQNDTLTSIGVGTSLVIPSDAVWRTASYLLQQSGGFSIQAIQTPFTASSNPSNAMLVYAVFYAAGALGLSTWVFGRRDL
ncbi:MAG: ABC transporter permease [Chloroflexota bacterium]|nr:ABC transporter permease [Chloroflexota bacterium]